MFKPPYANYCDNCGKDWERTFTKIRGIDNEDMNYCPTCGNELDVRNSKR